MPYAPVQIGGGRYAFRFACIGAKYAWKDTPGTHITDFPARKTEWLENKVQGELSIQCAFCTF